MGSEKQEWVEVGARIADARAVARLSQGDLAEAIGLERTAVVKLEAGDRKLSSLELVRLARVLNRPLDWFLSPSPPAVVSRRRSRASAGLSAADVLLENLGHDVALLSGLGLLSTPPAPAAVAVDSVETAERAAAGLRVALRVPPGPVWELQAVAARAGLHVFSIDLGNDALDGSYLRLGAGGVALVNGGHQTGRRRFTAVHELGHHVLADDYSTEWVVGTGGEDRERLINALAVHFLMPRDAVAARWQELRGHVDPRPAALALGAEFGVSWTAVAGQLQNLQLITDPVRRQLERDRPQAADYLEGGVALREELAPPSVPLPYAQAALRAYKSHKISGSRALELLRGTLRPEALPPANRIPVAAMAAELEPD